MLATCDPEKHQVLMLASRVPGEGVSTVSVGLARAIANNALKSVLYIHAGMDSGAASKMLGISGKAISLENIADAEVDFTPLQGTSSNIKLVQLELPDDLGEAQKGVLNEFIHRTCLPTTTVIVDAGSLTTRYPYVWSELVHYRLLVIDSSTTSSEELQRFRNQIDNSKVNFNGFVLNKRRYYIPKFFYRGNA